MGHHIQTSAYYPVSRDVLRYDWLRILWCTAHCFNEEWISTQERYGKGVEKYTYIASLLSRTDELK